VELGDEYCEQSKLKLTKRDREELAELILHDVLGLGALETLLEDPEVSEIMVNGPKTIFMERRGRITQSDLEFESEVQLRRVIDRIVARIGRRVDESSPMRATGRVATVEDTAELHLRQRNRVSVEARSANVEGRGAVAIRDLVVNALRMRPDRIVVGECRAGETLDMLQAMNTGHDGSMTTVHANSPKDALGRLETMVIMAGSALPFQEIREQIVGGITILVQQARLRDGRRVVTHISEITAIIGNQIQVQDICRFDQTGIDEEGNVLGTFRWSGVVPKLLPRLKANGEDFPTSVFGAAGLQLIEGSA